MSRKFFLFWMIAVALIIAIGTAWGVNTHSDFTTGNPVAGFADSNNVYVISNQLDFNDLATYATGGVTTQDVVQLLDIPAGTYVLNVGIRIVTATSTGGVTISATIGDGSDPNGWITDVDFGTSASGVSSTIEDNISGVYQTTDGGKYYSAADTIDATISDFSTYDMIAGSPESMLTDFVVQPWAIVISPSTQKAYGATQ